jgi:uncharacterized membrane protein
MGWKAAWFGSDDPSIKQVVRIVALFAVLALVMLGMFVDFAPAPFLYGGQWLLPMLLLGIVLTACLFLHAHRRGRMDQLFGKGVLHALLVTAMMPLLLGGCVWLVVAKTLPWAYTRTLGVPYRAPAAMLAHYSRSRHACDYRLQGGPMEHAFPGYLCIDERFYRNHPEQMVTVVLAGRRSRVGTAIIDVYAVSSGNGSVP